MRDYFVFEKLNARQREKTIFCGNFYEDTKDKTLDGKKLEGATLKQKIEAVT